MAVRAERGPRLRRPSFGGARALIRAPGAAVLVLYAATAVAATWPGVRALGDEYISSDSVEGFGEPGAGDHLQSVYRFWLVGHQLAHGRAPWRDPYSFQPLVEPQTVLAGWPFGPLFWPLEAAFGPVVAWNLLLLGTVVAAGLVTFAWLRALDLPAPAAALGGLAFAIAPYRIEQSGGHLLGWVAVFLPLALLALERARSASSRRAAHAWGALAAAAVASVPLSGQLHLALGIVPLVLAYGAVRYRPLPGAWALSGALAAAAVGVVIRVTLIAGSAEEGGRSLDEVREFSAEWVDLVSRRQLGGSEDFVFLGWLTPLLAVAGLVVLARRRRGLALVLAAAALVPVLLALGTNTPLYSPLWHAFPPLRFPRAPARLVPVADLALAALAAYAAAWLAARAGRRALAASAALLLLVGADLAVRPLGANASDGANRAYAVLAAERGRTLELPYFEPGVHYGSVYDAYTLQAPRERLNGYSTLAPERAYDFYFAHRRLSCGVWLPGDEATLERLGVTRLLFHLGLYRQAELRGAWFGWQGLLAHGFAPAARDGAVTLFAPGSSRAPAPVVEPPRDRPVLCGRWEGRTAGEPQTVLWIYGAGTAELHVGSERALPLRLWVDGRLADRRVVHGNVTLRPTLAGDGWHALLFSAAERGLRFNYVRL
jgi:hypothetical protein